MPDSIKDWKNDSKTRCYLVTKGPRNELLGIFSNRQKLMTALTFSGLDGCVIRGARKDKKVDDSTIGDEVVYHKRRCDIYCGDNIAYRVGLYGINNMNPKFIEEAKGKVTEINVEEGGAKNEQPRTLFDDFQG